MGWGVTQLEGGHTHLSGHVAMPQPYLRPGSASALPRSPGPRNSSLTAKVTTGHCSLINSAHGMENWKPCPFPSLLPWAAPLCTLHASQTYLHHLFLFSSNPPPLPCRGNHPSRDRTAFPPLPALPAGWMDGPGHEGNGEVVSSPGVQGHVPFGPQLCTCWCRWLRARGLWNVISILVGGEASRCRLGQL